MKITGEIDVRAIRKQLGISPDGGTQKPLSPDAFKKRLGSELEADFGPRWAALHPDLPFCTEYTFHPVRDFRFDFAWPDEGPDTPKRQSKGGVAVEIQGGIWKDKSGHNTGAGLTRDYEKMNMAQACNWVVFQFTDQMSRDPAMLQRVADKIRERRKHHERHTSPPGGGKTKRRTLRHCAFGK